MSVSKAADQFKRIRSKVAEAEERVTEKMIQLHNLQRAGVPRHIYRKAEWRLHNARGMLLSLKDIMDLRREDWEEQLRVNRATESGE